ncbi:unnamed protein product [Citrullus colocynthis]|uniref:Uncharacterized protein n=1 Tax=Citrullus colocynthis TaxID=252529 RepID=A0ABP0YZ81_9ROSI
MEADHYLYFEFPTSYSILIKKFQPKALNFIIGLIPLHIFILQRSKKMEDQRPATFLKRIGRTKDGREGSEIDELMLPVNKEPEFSVEFEKEKIDLHIKGQDTSSTT